MSHSLKSRHVNWPPTNLEHDLGRGQGYVLEHLFENISLHIKIKGGTQIMDIKKFKMEDVVSVYLGKPNKCMCGCSGNYAYTSLNSAYGEKDRGYSMNDGDVNDRKVNVRLNRYYNDPQKPNVVENYIFTKIIDGKQITVYLKEK
jgi:hypothetical protein